MRRHKKQKMQQIAAGYRNLCGLIPENLRQGEIGKLPYLLQNVQEASIDWGETIEALEKEDGDDSLGQVVLVLEEICEWCYRTSVELENGADGAEWEKQVKLQLDGLLDRVDRAVCDIAITYEFVFMPYKASMWDSLESIYLAAARDKNCSAYVVPLPYYEIEQSTGTRTYCYEGNLFPDAIPVTHYMEYDLKGRHPDAIFIHNPYDDCNLVTQIAAEYFSPKLKACTDELVYVPYFSTAGVTPELHRLLPVHYSMDHMVIQSEKESRYYTDPVLSGKLLPLGSPKVDKIINGLQGERVYPDGWREILQGKKVFFFNTSISAMLNDTEIAFEKLEYIFSCFENRTDAVVIWRPHPLLEATIRSVRPDYYERYRRIRQEFKERGIAILDETPDANTAILLSDAYIGESSSSVIHLFGVAGKPVYLLDYRILEEADDRQLANVSFTNIVECNGRLWTFLTTCNALCNVDADSGAIHVVTSVPGQNPFRAGLVSAVYAVGNDLILSPANMDRIAVYHTDTGEFDFHLLPNPEFAANLGGVCEETVCGEPTGRFFILPNRYEAIVEYEPKQKCFRFHTKVIEAIKDFGAEYRVSRPRFGAFWYSGDCGKMIFALARSNHIVIWDTRRDEFKIRELGTPGCGWSLLLQYGDGALLREYNGAQFWYWNWKTDTCAPVETILPDSFAARKNPDNEERPYAGFFAAHDHLLLLPQLGNEILELEFFDEQNRTLRFRTFPVDISAHIREPQTGLYDNRFGNLSGAYCWADRSTRLKKQVHELWLRFSADGQIVHLDTDTLACRELTPHADPAELRKLLSVSQAFGSQSESVPYAARESLYVSLPQFIDALSQGKLNNNAAEQVEAYRAVTANMDGTCGQKVFDAICKILDKR